MSCAPRRFPSKGPVRGAMSSNEKARDGLFRDLFAEQLTIIAVEAEITTQPLDDVSGFITWPKSGIKLPSYIGSLPGISGA
jgi:hypothetical protein